MRAIICCAVVVAVSLVAVSVIGVVVFTVSGNFRQTFCIYDL